MKCLMLALPGLFDRPDADKNIKTPLESASTPETDRLAERSSVGLVRTVPMHFRLPENAGALSILGLSPEKLPDMRASFELYGSGMTMKKDDAVLFCGFVSLSEAETYERRIMLCSHPGLNRSQLRQLTDALNRELGSSVFEFRLAENGSMFLLWHRGEPSPGTFHLPAAAEGREIAEYLPSGDFTPVFTDLMKSSAVMLAGHTVNAELKSGSKHTADSIWLWGAGAKPRLPAFEDSFGVRAAAISTDRYFSGIAKLSGLKTVVCAGEVSEEALARRADRAAAFAERYGLVYLYDDSLTKCTDYTERREAIELIDRQLIGRLVKKLRSCGGPFRLLLTADNAYPLSLGCPTLEAVPYLLFDSRRTKKHPAVFNESIPVQRFISDGSSLVSLLLEHSGA